MKLFVDLDGVLADFDTGYEQVFGYRPDKVKDDVDWQAVRRHQGFYENLPPMPDLDALWASVAPLNPTVLTGVPKSVEEAPENKKAWVRKNLGSDVPVICCLSKEKSLHCVGDSILIDDWDKYRHLWLAKGGIWILHQSAEQSISELNQHIAAGWRVA